MKQKIKWAIASFIVGIVAGMPTNDNSEQLESEFQEKIFIDSSHGGMFEPTTCFLTGHLMPS
jgi:hypothetical protein